MVSKPLDSFIPVFFPLILDMFRLVRSHFQKSLSASNQSIRKRHRLKEKTQTKILLTKCGIAHETCRHEPCLGVFRWHRLVVTPSKVAIRWNNSFVVLHHSDLRNLKSAMLFDDAVHIHNLEGAHGTSQDANKRVWVLYLPCPVPPGAWPSAENCILSQNIVKRDLTGAGGLLTCPRRGSLNSIVSLLRTGGANWELWNNQLLPATAGAGFSVFFPAYSIISMTETDLVAMWLRRGGEGESAQMTADPLTLSSSALGLFFCGDIFATVVKTSFTLCCHTDVAARCCLTPCLGCNAWIKVADGDSDGFSCPPPAKIESCHVAGDMANIFAPMWRSWRLRKAQDQGSIAST